MAPPARLILYGDSIAESWRETGVGKSVPRNMRNRPVKGNLAAFRTSIVDRYGPAAAMAIAADPTRDLLWRLQNGELPLVSPAVFLVHIGTNDVKHLLNLSAIQSRAVEARVAQQVYFNIKAIIQELWGRCRAPIVLTAIFPRDTKWPGGVFGKRIPRINGMLKELAHKSLGTLHVLDCSRIVLNNAEQTINRTLMPDFLHLGPVAMARSVECLRPTLDKLLSCQEGRL